MAEAWDRWSTWRHGSTGFPLFFYVKLCLWVVARRLHPMSNVPIVLAARPGNSFKDSLLIFFLYLPEPHCYNGRNSKDYSKGGGGGQGALKPLDAKEMPSISPIFVISHSFSSQTFTTKLYSHNHIQNKRDSEIDRRRSEHAREKETKS